MGKEEMKPEKKKMTSMDYGNIIIKYANESGGIDKEELILAGKLLGRGSSPRRPTTFLLINLAT